MSGGARSTGLERVFNALWWVWPAALGIILVAQHVGGRGVFGYAVIPLGIGMAAGSLAFGAIGVVLLLRRPSPLGTLWRLLQTLAAAAPVATWAALLAR